MVTLTELRILRTGRRQRLANVYKVSIVTQLVFMSFENVMVLCIIIITTRKINLNPFVYFRKCHIICTISYEKTFGDHSYLYLTSLASMEGIVST